MNSTQQSRVLNAHVPQIKSTAIIWWALMATCSSAETKFLSISKRQKQTLDWSCQSIQHCSKLLLFGRWRRFRFHLVPKGWCTNGEIDDFGAKHVNNTLQAMDWWITLVIIKRTVFPLKMAADDGNDKCYWLESPVCHSGYMALWTWWRLCAKLGLKYESVYKHQTTGEAKRSSLKPLEIILSYRTTDLSQQSYKNLRNKLYLKQSNHFTIYPSQ